MQTALNALTHTLYNVLIADFFTGAMCKSGVVNVWFIHIL